MRLSEWSRQEGQDHRGLERLEEVVELNRQLLGEGGKEAWRLVLIQVEECLHN